MTCAACHTNEWHVNNVAYRIDGAPTQANIQAFVSDMIVAVKNTADDAAKLITDRTRAILLVTPANPTGVTLSPDTIAAFARLAAARGIALVLDELKTKVPKAGAVKAESLVYTAPLDQLEKEGFFAGLR